MSAAIRPVARSTFRSGAGSGRSKRIRWLEAAAEAEALGALRDSWSDVVGVRSPRHDEYRFHITIGYLIRPLGSREIRDALVDMASWKARMTRRSPIIEFGRPKYCTFDDMFTFKRQFFL